MSIYSVFGTAKAAPEAQHTCPHASSVAAPWASHYYHALPHSLLILLSYTIAGDLLRNFGAANVGGVRGGYERAIKLCYGLSILGAVPLVVLPFYNLVLPLFVGFEKDHPAPTPRSESGRKHHLSDEEEESAWAQQQRGLLASPSTTFSGGSTGSVRDRDRDGSRERESWGKESRETKSSPRGSTEADSWEATSKGVRARPDVVDIKLHHDVNNVSDAAEGCASKAVWGGRCGGQGLAARIHAHVIRVVGCVKAQQGGGLDACSASYFHNYLIKVSPS